jgi:hypothetical protein
MGKHSDPLEETVVSISISFDTAVFSALTGFELIKNSFLSFNSMKGA